MVTRQIPSASGWYFARWIVAAPGTPNAEYLVPGDDVECVMVQDLAQDGAPEFLNAWVAGVDMPQPLENFEWHGEVTLPRAPDEPPEPASDKPTAARALVEAAAQMREAKDKHKAPRRGLGSY